MQVAPSDLSQIKPLLNKVLQFNVIFCLFGVLSLKLVPFNPCILILIVEMASKPFSDFYAGQRSFRLK